MNRYMILNYSRYFISNADSDSASGYDPRACLGNFTQALCKSLSLRKRRIRREKVEGKLRKVKEKLKNLGTVEKGEEKMKIS